MKPPHTDFTDSNDASAVIDRLHTMFDGQYEIELPPAASPRVANTRVALQRVAVTSKNTINTYHPKKKQKYIVGTKVRIPEIIRGKQVVFTGHVRAYDATTNSYTILFEDGEEDDDFDEDDVKAFKVTGRPRVAANNALRHYPNANPLIVQGFSQRQAQPTTNGIMLTMLALYLMKNCTNG